MGWAKGEMNQESRENDVRTLSTIFADIPEEPIRRALEITGSADAASDWLLEFDWRELMIQEQSLLAATNTTNVAAAAQADDEDEVEDEEEQAAVPPPKRARKVVSQSPQPSDESESFWCSFDSTLVRKGHLQLMNLRPRTLSHSRIVLWTRNSQNETEASAKVALSDVWAHCLPPKDPGYWLIPLSLEDLDDVWWKLLEPLLLKKCLTEVAVIQTLGGFVVRGGSSSASSSGGGQDGVVAFDDIQDRETEQQQQRQRANHRSFLVTAAALARRSASHESRNPVACLLLLASATPSELDRVGKYLAALFPHKAPIYFRRLRGTAAGDNNAADKFATTDGSRPPREQGDVKIATAATTNDESTTATKPAAFAHDPRADPVYVEPEWHRKHADFRVTKHTFTTTPPPDTSSSGILRLATPFRAPTFVLEHRSPDEWTPLGNAKNDGKERRKEG